MEAELKALEQNTTWEISDNHLGRKPEVENECIKYNDIQMILLKDLKFYLPKVTLS